MKKSFSAISHFYGNNWASKGKLWQWRVSHKGIRLRDFFKRVYVYWNYRVVPTRRPEFSCWQFWKGTCSTAFMIPPWLKTRLLSTSLWSLLPVVFSLNCMRSPFKSVLFFDVNDWFLFPDSFFAAFFLFLLSFDLFRFSSIECFRNFETPIVTGLRYSFLIHVLSWHKMNDRYSMRS